MKMIQIFLTATFLVSMALGQSANKFTVEKLSAAEVTDLNEARARLVDAQANFDRIENRIKETHGQVSFSPFVNTNCAASYKTIELKGEYALITTEIYNVCGTNQPVFTMSQ